MSEPDPPDPVKNSSDSPKITQLNQKLSFDPNDLLGALDEQPMILFRRVCRVEWIRVNDTFEMDPPRSRPHISMRCQAVAVK